MVGQGPPTRFLARVAQNKFNGMIKQSTTGEREKKGVRNLFCPGKKGKKGVRNLFCPERLGRKGS